MNMENGKNTGSRKNGLGAGNGRNMFDPRPGKRPARFVGRDDVLRDIAAALEDREENENIMIFTGISGSGKTSVLAEARAYANGQGNVYFLDDVDKEKSEHRDFLLGYNCAAKQGETPMLLMAGLPHAVDELIKDEEMAFLRKARRVPMRSVSEEEIFALYAEAFAGGESGDSGEDGGCPALKALRRAAEAASGYPYLIQLIGYYLSKEGKTLNDKVVDKAVFLAKIELYKNIHEPLVWDGSSKDRAFLWAMAQDKGASEFGEIARRMGVSAGYASKYRERLINAGLIFSSAYGELAFTLPYMREYIEKEYIERHGGEGGKRRL